MKRKALPILRFGPLPVATINRLLGLELDPGETVMSAGAQIHARRRHSADYGRLVPHIAAVVASPLYVGDDVRNAGKIELIGRPPGWAAEALLVAVAIARDDAGNYNVVSCYPVSEEKVHARRERGFLLVATGGM